MHRLEISDLDVGHPETGVNSNGSTFEGWRKGPNSAGGVCVRQRIYNVSGKPMVNISFTYIASNLNGGEEVCEISHKSEAVGQITDPLFPNTDRTVTFSNLWYNPLVWKAKINDVRIQYSDKTEETISGDELKNMYDKDSEFSKTHKSEAAQIRLANKITAWINKVTKKS